MTYSVYYRGIFVGYAKSPAGVERLTKRAMKAWDRAIKRLEMAEQAAQAGRAAKPRRRGLFRSIGRGRKSRGS